MAKEPVVIALDLGGTNMRWALVTRQGKLLDRWEHLTGITQEQEIFLSSLAADLKACGQKAQELGAEVQGVGLGIPGRILPAEGVVVFSPNIPALNACPLVPTLKPQLPWPLSLENDANLFALGEHWLGAGAGFSEMLGITLGTGVGGGLILNGRIWSGTAGTSGEVGHTTIEPEGKKCHCGNRGCLETVASGVWAVEWVKEQLAQGASSWLQELWRTDPDALVGETLVVAAGQNDPLALRAFERVGRGLGQAIANVVHLLGLNRVVIGGRFARAWELFATAMEEELYRRLTLFPPAAVSIVPAKLGDDAGLLGAARLAWDKLGEG
ncbi:MAG: ROK family protein [Thermodesulfobacteriota bacterium]